MRIGLDLDGVVANWVRSVILNLNKFRGTNIDPGFEPDHWDWFENNLKKEDWDWLWRGGCFQIFSDAPPYGGAEQFVNQLEDLGDVIVVTSRPRIAKDATYIWWNRHMETLPMGFNFFSSGFQKYKVNVDVLIEDNYENSIAYIDKTYMNIPQVFLLDRPWNRAYDVKSEGYLELTRVHSYDEIITNIKELKELTK